MCLRTWIAHVLIFSHVVHACCPQISYVITCLRASLTSFVLFSLHFSFYLEKYLEPTRTPIKEFFEKNLYIHNLCIHTQLIHSFKLSLLV